MALYLPIVKTITITKLIDLFLNKVVRRFRTPRGLYLIIVVSLLVSSG